MAHQTSPYEVIVADGGSTDMTRDIACNFAQVVDARRGRANQMNAGAAVASGDVLLFLHADTQLPLNALDMIRRATQDEAEAGIFRLKFNSDSPLLNFYSFFTRFKWPKFGFGDRGLFVQSDVFEQLGGFASIPVFEALDLVHRLHNRGKFVFLKGEVTTAARRFEKTGYLRQQLLNSYLWIRYMTGTPPDKLARLYRYDRAPAETE